MDENVLIVDLNNLELECSQQPRLFIRFARIVADQQDQADQLERQMKVLEAELDLEIRSNPKEYSIEKITEKAITATILTSQETKDLYTKTAEAKHKLKIAQAMIAALDQKKRMIEKAVDLHGQQYFAKPYVPNKTALAVCELDKKEARTKKRKKKCRRKS